MPLPRPVRTWKESTQRGDTLAPKSSAQPLKAWQLAYLEWLSNQERRPPASRRVEKANEFRAEHGVEGPPLDARRLRVTMSRKYATEYFEKLEKDAFTRCRARIENTAFDYVTAHKRGLDWALAKHDYKAIPAFADSIMERVWPRKEAAQVNTQVNIVLSAQQQRAIAAIDGDDPVVDAELVDAELDE